MRYMIFTSLACVVISLITCMCGCGGGGASTPGVSGTVFAPGTAVLSSLKGLRTRTVAGVPTAAGLSVTLGSVSDDGTVFTPLAGATTTTDQNGHYLIPVTANFVPGPQYNVVVGPTNSPTLSSLVLALTTNISPVSQAARNILYTNSRALNKPISKLNSPQVLNFLNQATTVCSTLASSTSLDDAVTACTTAINNDPSSTATLKAISNVNTGYLDPTCLMPEFGEVGSTTVVRIKGYALAPAPSITENVINTPSVTATVTSTTANDLAVSFVIKPEAAPGYHFFTMRREDVGNPDQTAQIALFVRSKTDPPHLSAISPIFCVPKVTGDVIVSMTLTGLAFDVPGATIIFTPMVHIDVLQAYLVSPHQINAKFIVHDDVMPSDYLVAVRTASGTSEGATFTVKPPHEETEVHPHLSSISPKSYTYTGKETGTVVLNVHFTASNIIHPHPYPFINVSDGFGAARNITATGFNSTLRLPLSFLASKPGSLSVTFMNDTTGQIFSNAVKFTIVDHSL